MSLKNASPVAGIRLTKISNAWATLPCWKDPARLHVWPSRCTLCWSSLYQIWIRSKANPGKGIHMSVHFPHSKDSPLRISNRSNIWRINCLPQEYYCSSWPSLTYTRYWDKLHRSYQRKSINFSKLHWPTKRSTTISQTKESLGNSFHSIPLTSVEYWKPLLNPRRPIEVHPRRCKNDLRRIIYYTHPD